MKVDKSVMFAVPPLVQLPPKQPPVTLETVPVALPAALDFPLVSVFQKLELIVDVAYKLPTKPPAVALASPLTKPVD